MVSAWACASGVTLGQTGVDSRSNEITAIPRLLEMLQVNGCIVTIDAMGCQKEIASKILEEGADYVLAVKGNHGRLHEGMADVFDLTATLPSTTSITTTTRRLMQITDESKLADTGRCLTLTTSDMLMSTGSGRC